MVLLVSAADGCPGDAYNEAAVRTRDQPPHPDGAKSGDL